MTNSNSIANPTTNNISATSHQHRRLIILGSGPAGCTAAIYAARANLAPTMLTGAEHGGQLVKTSMVDNWPGDHAGVLGFDLMERMQQHVERFGVEVIHDHIEEVNLLQGAPFLLKGSGTTYSCDALIIATGAKPRFLGLPAEQRLLGHGVSTCATCDGFFYRGARVAVVGGGSTAVDDAICLAELAQEVIVIHRRDHFTAEHVLIEKLQQHIERGKIRVLWQHTVSDIVGDDAVAGIKVKNLVNGEIKAEAVAGVFIAVGFEPYSKLFTRQIAMFDDGYIKVQGYGADGNASFTATSVPGVFAAGDIANRNYRQAIAAAGMGCMAALDAKRYLMLK